MNNRFSVIFEAVADQWNKVVNGMNQEMANLNATLGKIDANSDKAASGISKLTNADDGQIETMANDLKEAARELREMDEGANIAGGSIKVLGNTVKAEMTAIKSEIAQAKLEFKQLSQTSASPEDLDRAAAKIQNLENNLKTVTEAAKASKRALEDMAKDSSDNVKALKTQLDAAKQSLKDINDVPLPLEDIKRATDFVDELNAELDQVVAQSKASKRALEDMADESATKIKGIKSELDTAKQALKDLGNVPLPVEEITELEKSIEDLSAELEEARRDSENTKRSLEDMANNASDKVKSISRALADARAEMRKLKEEDAGEVKIKAAKDAVTALEDSLREARKASDEAGKSLRDTAQTSERGMKDLRELIKDAREELKRLNDTSASPQDIEEAENKVRALANALNEAEQEAGATDAALKNLAKTSSRDIQDLKEMIQLAKEELKQLSNVSAAPQDIEQAEKKVKDLSDALNQAQQQADAASNALRDMSRESTRDIEDMKAALRNAKEELEQLNRTDASLEDLEQAKNRVRDLESDLRQLGSAWDEYQNEAVAANARVRRSIEESGDAANSAGKQIYNSLNIRPATVIIADINNLNRQLEEFRRQSTAPADEITRVTRQAEAQIRRLQDELRGVTDQSVNAANGFNGMSKSLAGMATTYLGLDLIVEALRAIVDTTMEFERIYKKIEYSASDMATAASDLEFVSEIARKLGIDIVATGEGFGKLAAATKGTAAEGEITRNVFLGVAQAGATMGLTTENMNGVLLALAQIAGKGRVQMEELRGQLGERLTPAINIAAKGLGVTTAQLIQMVEQGIDATTFLNAFGPAMQEAFSGTAEKNATTLIGTINLLRNEFKYLLNDVGSGAGGAAIIKVLTDLRKLIEDIRESTSSFDPLMVESLNEAFSRFYETVKDVSVQFGSAITDTLSMIDELAQAILVFSDITDDSFEDAGEKVSFFTRILQGISVTMAAISDGIYAIRMGFNLVSGAVIDFGGFVADVMSKITFGDVSDSFKRFAEDLDKIAEQQYAKTQQMAIDFQSRTIQAMNAAAETNGEAYSTMAEKALAELNKIKVGQDDASNAVYDATLKYVEAAVAANVEAEIAAKAAAAASGQQVEALTGVEKSNARLLDQTTRMIAQQKGYAAEIDLSGNVILRSLDEVYATGESTFKRIQVVAGETGAAMFNLNTPIEAASGSLYQLGQQAGVTFPIAARDAEGMALTLGMVVGESREAAKVIGDSIPKAVEKLNAAELSRFTDVFIAGMQKAGADVEYVNKQIRTLADISAKSLGVSINAALTSTSDSFNRNRDLVQKLNTDYDRLRDAGVNANVLIKESLESMLAKTKNPIEIRELIKLWEEMGRAGRIAGKDLADGIDAAKAKLDELTPGINSVEEAFKKLGLTSRAESAKMAASYGAAYGLIESSGQATTAQLQEAFRKYATAAIAANGGVSNAYLDSKAAALGLSLEVDNIGKVSIDSANKTISKSKEVISVNEQVAASYTTVGLAGVSASQDYVDQLTRQIEMQKQAMEIAKKMDEIESNRRGATVTSAGNLGGTTAMAYSVENIVAKLKEMGFDGNRSRVEGKRIFDSWATDYGNKPFWAGGQLSNYNYVNEQLAEMADNVGGTKLGGGVGGSPDRKVEVTFRSKGGGSGTSVTMNTSDEASLLRTLEEAGDVST